MSELIPVKTGLNLAPAAGPMTIKHILSFNDVDLNTADAIDFDLAKQDMDDNFGMAQAVWFNNRTNPSMVEFIIGGSEQRVYFPAFAMGMLPIIQSGSLRVRALITTPGTVAALRINWLNTPQPSFVYSPT